MVAAVGTCFFHLLSLLLSTNGCLLLEDFFSQFALMSAQLAENTARLKPRLVGPRPEMNLSRGLHAIKHFVRQTLLFLGWQSREKRGTAGALVLIFLGSS